MCVCAALATPRHANFRTAKVTSNSKLPPWLCLPTQAGFTHGAGRWVGWAVPREARGCSRRSLVQEVSVCVAVVWRPRPPAGRVCGLCVLRWPGSCAGSRSGGSRGARLAAPRRRQQPFGGSKGSACCVGKSMWKQLSKFGGQLGVRAVSSWAWASRAGLLPLLLLRRRCLPAAQSSHIAGGGGRAAVDGARGAAWDRVGCSRVSDTHVESRRKTKGCGTQSPPCTHMPLLRAFPRALHTPRLCRTHTHTHIRRRAHTHLHACTHCASLAAHV